MAGFAGRAIGRPAGRPALSGLLALCALACSCEPAAPVEQTIARPGPGEYMKVVQRFAATPAGAAEPILRTAATATILDDTRYVLAAPAFDIVVWPTETSLGASERTLTLEPVLPPKWRSAAEIVAMPQLAVDAQPSMLPPRVVATQRGPLSTLARIEVRLPKGPSDARALLSIPAYAIGLVELASLPTPEIEIPDGAVLEFAIGLVEPAYGFDPVDFEIEACRGGECARVFRERFDPKAESGPGWRNRRIPLAALAGTRQQLVFRARRTSEQAPFSFPVWAHPTLYAPAPRGPEQVNVILLSIDTLRANHLTPYGYERDTSPFMAERFGKRGTIFDNLVASATITSPSHASMFTALQPITHQTTEGMKELPYDVATLAERARSAGIDTGAVTENGWMSANFGFARGFDAFRELKSGGVMHVAGQVDLTFANARSWLRWNQDKHFFLFLHTFQVHSPYAPPARYAGLFTQHAGRAIDASTPEHLRAMADYDREIRYTDDELRGLFESLDELGRSEDTVFIVTSDHGEAFLEHGLLEHGGYLTEEMVHVPLMLSGRGIPEGLRVPALASHVDLMPTILELLGAPGPGVKQGSSLLALMRASEHDASLGERATFSESPAMWATGAGHKVVGFRGPAYMVRKGTRKLARYPADAGFEYRYFDLARDPLEQRDLYPSHAAEAADLVELLEGNLEHGEALRAHLAGRAAETDTGKKRTLLDPQQEATLRALGYLE